MTFHRFKIGQIVAANGLDAIDLGLVDQVADLLITHPALGALKTDESHSGPPRQP